jgi:hypothetical protein
MENKTFKTKITDSNSNNKIQNLEGSFQHETSLSITRTSNRGRKIVLAITMKTYLIVNRMETQVVHLY